MKFASVVEFRRAWFVTLLYLRRQWWLDIRDEDQPHYKERCSVCKTQKRPSQKHFATLEHNSEAWGAPKESVQLLLSALPNHRLLRHDDIEGPAVEEICKAYAVVATKCGFDPTGEDFKKFPDTADQVFAVCELGQAESAISSLLPRDEYATIDREFIKGYIAGHQPTQSEVDKFSKWYRKHSRDLSPIFDLEDLTNPRKPQNAWLDPRTLGDLALLRWIEDSGGRGLVPSGLARTLSQIKKLGGYVESQDWRARIDDILPPECAEYADRVNKLFKTQEGTPALDSILSRDDQDALARLVLSGRCQITPGLGANHPPSKDVLALAVVAGASKCVRMLAAERPFDWLPWRVFADPAVTNLDYLADFASNLFEIHGIRIWPHIEASMKKIRHGRHTFGAVKSRAELVLTGQDLDALPALPARKARGERKGPSDGL